MSEDGKLPTYDDVVTLMGRLEDNPYGDRIEAARWPDETRAEAKRRLMQAVYEADMRKKYAVRPKHFSQGDGRPYDTNNWFHFTERYGMRYVPSIAVGIFRETPAQMMQAETAENGARLALRLLSADGTG